MVPGIALVGLVLIGLAVASATVWKPPQTVTASHEIGSGASLLWTDPGVLEAWDDQVNIEVTTKNVPGVVVAIGRSNDVAMWVADSPFERISGLSSFDVFSVTNGGSNEPVVAAQDSDLWVASREVTKSQTITWHHKKGQWSLLVAPLADADGEFGSLAGTTVSMTWTRVVDTPYFLRGVVVGAVLLAAGLAVLVWDIRHRRRKALADERLAAREAGLQREAGPEITRRSQVAEETRIIKAIDPAVPPLEEGGQVAPMPASTSPVKLRRGRAHRSSEPALVEPADVADAATAGTHEPAADPAAGMVSDQALPGLDPALASRAAFGQRELPVPGSPVPEVLTPATGPSPSAASELPLSDSAPKPVLQTTRGARAAARAQDSAPEPAVSSDEPLATAEPVGASPIEPSQGTVGRVRRLFGGRKKTAAGPAPAVPEGQLEPEAAQEIDLGLATPVRSWEKIAQADQAKPDTAESALPMFGAKVDPVLGPIAAPAIPTPMVGWGLGATATPSSGPASYVPTTDQKIEALKAAHSNTASQAAATIAAAMAASQGTGTTAGLTRRQIREAERAAQDALRATRQVDLDLSRGGARDVEMQGEDGP